MPSDPPQRSSKASCSGRKLKQPIRSSIAEDVSSPPFLVASSPSSGSESEAEERKPSQSKRQKPVMVWKKRIRVICTDPDATDSSSDDDDDGNDGGGGGGGMAIPKRLVREILIPSHCCAFPSVVAESSIRSSSSDGYGRGFSFLPVKAKEEEEEERTAREETRMVSVKKDSPSLPKASEKKDSPSLPGCGRKSSRRIGKTHVVSAGKCGSGEAQRRGGKWSVAEARYPWEGIRLWLGPCSSSAARLASSKRSSRQEENMANPNPNPNPRLANVSSCLLPSLRCLSAGEDAENGSILHCPNSRDLSFVGDSIRGEESVVEPFSSSCYSGFGSLSPSSVLENSDCGSPTLFNADYKASCCTVADAYNMGEAPIDPPTLPKSDDLMTSEMALCREGRSSHASQMKLESSQLPYNVLLSAHPLLEESQYYSDLSQVFNARSSDCGESLDHHLDAELFAGDAGFGDMDFDIETETLAWINVAGV